MSRTAFTTDAGCFREFGGEEWYIHEKYRQAGAKCLCLPFLRWQHRFADPAAGRREDRAHPDEDGRRLRLDVARVPTLGEPGDHRNRDLHAELLGVVMDGERQALLELALSEINPNFRAVLVLREIEGLDYSEIAEILELSLGTVKSRMLRGRDALRSRLMEHLKPAEAPARWQPRTVVTE